MNYPESKQILEEIKKANKVLLNCHRGPDPDTVSAALSMKQVLKIFGKESEIVCPEEMRIDLSFLEGFKTIKAIDFSNYDFSTYDLFIIMDSSSFDVVTGFKEVQLPKLKAIVIDHHVSNTNYGDINLVDGSMSSMGEMLYKIFQDWQVKVDTNTANCLLTGIMADTGNFMFPGTQISTFRIAADLMETGADKNSIMFELFRKKPISLVKTVGELLRIAQLDENNKFAWSTMDYKTFLELGAEKEAKNVAHALLFQNIEGTNFGLIIVEQEPQKLSVSFRSRTLDFDISPMAVELGGGGHKVAAGATLFNTSFEDGVMKVLETAKKYAHTKKS